MPTPPVARLQPVRNSPWLHRSEAACQTLTAITELTREHDLVVNLIADVRDRVAGIVMAVLAIPATAALVSFVRARSGWRFVAGPVVYDVFIMFMLIVDYWLALEFRTPRRAEILIPYLVLFFGSILLMGPRCCASTGSSGR